MFLGYLDPSKPFITQNHLSKADRIGLEPAPVISNGFAWLRLPLEVVLMILGCLTPWDVIQFLLTSKQALLYATAFCRQNPHYFYRCSDTVGNENDERKLVIALAAKFSIAGHHELETRWEMVSKIARIAALVPYLGQDCAAERTLDPRAPLQLLDHHFGLREATLQIPDHVKAIDVNSIMLNGRRYVCGIGFQDGTANCFFGNKTGLLYKQCLTTAMNTIKFAVDALGVRFLEWGTDKGLSKAGTSAWWEGFTQKQGCQKIKIVYDALKFRHVSWCLDSPCSFAETLLIRGEHIPVLGCGYISKEYYIQQHPVREAELIAKFGNFTTEALWFGQDLERISIYSSEGLKGIFGVSIQRSSMTYSVGTCRIELKSMTLSVPAEVLTEIDVWTSDVGPLDIALKTSYNRQLHCSQPGTYATMRSLQPPSGYYIGGLFFRFGAIYIESVGIICAALPLDHLYRINKASTES
ncbi:F-box protein [Aspergillus undulatus]|uniref:F-box protein n=1 Tax=Aspergillus undulatus TaxID=1810928 RepID=UPI003CCE1040